MITVIKYFTDKNCKITNSNSVNTHLENSLSIILSQILPNIKNLVKGKQCQISSTTINTITKRHSLHGMTFCKKNNLK